MHQRTIPKWQDHMPSSRIAGMSKHSSANVVTCLFSAVRYTPHSSTDSVANMSAMCAEVYDHDRGNATRLGVESEGEHHHKQQWIRYKC
jgi:hypothetical protein